MLKIGDFSKLSRVTVKTLRYYDEVGLLRPTEVDPFTGYRYYALDQLPRLNRILALKDLGFALEQIAQIVNEGVSPEQLRGILRLKRAEQQQRVQEEQERLARVEARLRQIEMENTMSKYDVLLKPVEVLHVASVRAIVPSYKEQGELWQELYGALGPQHTQFTGPCLSIYYDEEYQERDVDTQACQPVGAAVKLPGPPSRVQVHDLPAANVACVVHHGPFTTITQAYNAVVAWIEANGYRVVGPAREIYLRPPKVAGEQNDPDCLTEIQFPVEK
jgi:DNA-binding transcriptional MerR regulator